MPNFKTTALLAKVLLTNARIIKAGIPLTRFLAGYMGKFQITNLDGTLIIHSHLPALNSKAYSKFINKHLLEKTKGPSHAQIAVTSRCPHACSFCYNKEREGHPTTTEEIIHAVEELKNLGVFWLGITGGEPLLNKDLEKILSSAGDSCALKLFTSGTSLTEERAQSLKDAGLLYVSVSLDHWEAEKHDASRNSKGSFKEALKALELFKRAGLHVSVSSVLSKEMLEANQIETFLEFLIEKGVHEAWLSETKPTGDPFWNKEFVITKSQHQRLMKIQDTYNKQGRITVNYLGHFESGEFFGCNAGNKMIYIDPFGEVNPCVFVPLSFGNIKESSLEEIFATLKQSFPSESRCFINKNYELIKKHVEADKKLPLSTEESRELLEEVEFSPLARFTQLNKRKG